MLDTADLAGMRETMIESLPDVCEILTHTLSSDGAGGHTPSGAAAVTVACRVGPMRLTRSSANAEIVEVGRVVEQSLWLVTMPHGTAISPTAQIRHLGPSWAPLPTDQRRVLEVVEVLSPRSNSVDTRASAKLVNSGRG